MMKGFYATSKAIGLLLLLLLVTSALSGQKMNKQDIYRMGRHLLEERFKEKMQTLKALQDLPIPHTKQRPVNPSTTEVSTREDNVAITTTADKPESEIHAAINPLDSNNLIVAGMQYGEGLLFPELSFPVYYSKDFGQTWKQSNFNGVNQLGLALVLGGGDPVIAFDDKGVAYLSWLTFTVDLTFSIDITLRWAVSTDGGATWEEQDDVIDNGVVLDLQNPDSRFVDKQWMATDLHSQYKGNLYIAYAEINLQDTTYNILVKRKQAGKSTLDTTVIDITPGEIVFAQFSSIDVDRQGRVHVMFTGATVLDTAFALYHSLSIDGGKTFATPKKISELTIECFPPDTSATCPMVGIDPNRVYPCPHLRVDRSGGTHDGNLYAVWTADGTSTKATAGWDIYYSRSTDHGATWSVAKKLNQDGNASTYQFYPSLAVNEAGTLIVGWYDRRDDPANVSTQYYLTQSTDGGVTFVADYPVTSAPSDFAQIGLLNSNFGIGEYTQVCATRGYAIPFWADGRTNDGNIEIYFAIIDLAGTTVGINPLVSISQDFQAKAPSPNPLNETSQLAITLQKPTTIHLELWSLDGKLYRQTDFGTLPAGDHVLPINSNQLPTGIAMLRVRTKWGEKTWPVVKRGL